MYLADSVYAARIDDDVVLLDVRRGEYYCLAGAAVAFDFDPAAPRILDEDLREALTRGDLLSETPSASRLEIGSAGHGQLTLAPVALRAGEATDALASYAVMMRRFYGRGFGSIVAYAQHNRPRKVWSVDATRLERRVAAFRTWLPWAPFPGVCLFRSFMLLAFLRRAHLDASWVFGVRTWPFEAHCWLQHGDLVLDDTADNVLGYTPIFRV